MCSRSQAGLKRLSKYTAWKRTMLSCERDWRRLGRCPMLKAVYSAIINLSELSAFISSASLRITAVGVSTCETEITEHYTRVAGTFHKSEPCPPSLLRPAIITGLLLVCHIVTSPGTSAPGPCLHARLPMCARLILECATLCASASARIRNQDLA